VERIQIPGIFAGCMGGDRIALDERHAEISASELVRSGATDYTSSYHDNVPRTCKICVHLYTIETPLITSDPLVGIAFKKADRRIH